ncbi:MAG: endonuclease III [Ignavibacteriales bacterium CG18_big_fil_WC_8_21_14_2_50_31_20]|nr:MAG: endonuclease III [Ignavibacteriales bacterium CG18_big_fil_WC_8_21_14_2_50_31_20]
MNNYDSGIYILELFAKENFLIANNKFNNVTFPKGFYYYIGSAQKNLKSRIYRHLAKQKKIHWHIDFLSTHKSLKISNVFVIPNALKVVEAEIANSFVEYFNAKIIAEGFGNSDTKETKTHLFFKNKQLSNSVFEKYYNRVVVHNK